MSKVIYYKNHINIIQKEKLLRLLKCMSSLSIFLTFRQRRKSMTRYGHACLNTFKNISLEQKSKKVVIPLLSLSHTHSLSLSMSLFLCLSFSASLSLSLFLCLSFSVSLSLSFFLCLSFSASLSLSLSLFGFFLFSLLLVFFSNF